MMQALRCRPFVAGSLLVRRGIPLQQRCHATSSRKTNLHLISRSPAATEALATLLAEAGRPGDVFLLYGNVGAGKSHFR